MADVSQYNLSLSDLIMGFLFVFILILMKFMLEYENKKTELLHPLKERIKLLEVLKKDLKKKNVSVAIDKENGVLSLTNLHYFDKGSYQLSSKGKEDFRKIKKIFEQHLICYSDLENNKTKEQWLKRYGEDNFKVWIKYCNNKTNKNKYALIDSILIEGHADSTPIGSRLKEAGIKTNLDLAINRSQTVLFFLTDYKEATKTSSEKGNYFYMLSNQKGHPLFGVTSYGNLRRKSLRSRDPGSGSSKNRRIDIRFIMSQYEHLKNELKNRHQNINVK